MKQAIIFLFAMITIIACNNKKEENKEPVAGTTVEVSTDTASDSAAIRAVIIDFYNWYNSHYKKLMGYDLYSSIKKKNEAPYKMNWDEVKKYQDFINDSIPQLGDAFLLDQKRMFEKADSAFKVDLKDDVPAYFDYDWYTNSQEDPSYLLEGIKASGKWIINVKEDDASVEIGAPEDKNYVAGSL
ncbi:MAG TPA: hypothetical protein VMZ03_11490, partial [Chitinophagaceae bacterium]|nr:hypothetical protein [Chitinophagaceae bacterium]